MLKIVLVVAVAAFAGCALSFPEPPPAPVPAPAPAPAAPEAGPTSGIPAPDAAPASGNASNPAAGAGDIKLKPFDQAIAKCASKQNENDKSANQSDACVLRCAIQEAGLHNVTTKELSPKKFSAYLEKYEPESYKQVKEYVEQCWIDCKHDSNEQCASYRHFFVCIRIRPIIPSKATPAAVPNFPPPGKEPTILPVPGAEPVNPGTGPVILPVPGPGDANATAPVAPTK